MSTNNQGDQLTYAQLWATTCEPVERAFARLGPLPTEKPDLVPAAREAAGVR